MMHGHAHGRVHPAASSSDFSGEMNQSVSAHSSDPSPSPLHSFHFEKPVPPPPPPQPGTYVVQVPKDKVFRVPPPENARLFEHYTRRAKRRSRCSCFRVCTCLLAALLALAVLLAALGGVMYLVFKPKRPAYSVQALAVSGLGGIGNASTPGAFSPAFDATVRADNPNGKIGVHYEGEKSHVSVSYDGVTLADGAWPSFYQVPRNVTVFVAKAKGSGIRFSQSVRGQMAAAERLRSVPFDLAVEVPVRLQLGKLKTWAVPVRVRCTVAVDRLAADAKVVSRSCDVKVWLLSWRN
ncbi:NDR1/HIN1-like protein 13 [Phragmites australis]|uniref:NDR1/HIN1-like protein 13 n=1 Tax=Phragmites australis TaxID=29695 RepID=UPI002D79DC84|nr:NDR1/HIN1-like protein 13 [Phragmites australis]